MFSVRGHAFGVQEPATFLCDPTVGGQVRRRHGAGGGRCGWRAPFMVRGYALRKGLKRAGESRRQTAPKTRSYGVRVGGDGRGERCEKVRLVDESRELAGAAVSELRYHVPAWLATNPLSFTAQPTPK